MRLLQRNIRRKPHPDIHKLGRLFQVVGDLYGEFSCRGENEGGESVLLWKGQVLEDRQGVGECFSGSLVTVRLFGQEREKKRKESRTVSAVPISPVPVGGPLPE